MKPIIALIDWILIAKGKKALRDIERSTLDPRRANEELLLRILKDNADTEYGRKYGFAEIKSIDEYRKRVPLTDYDAYSPYIERMMKGKEKNLITSYPVIQYAETSGTIGAQKMIPVTRQSMEIYGKYAFGRIKATADRAYRERHGAHVPWGKGLNMAETELTIAEDGTPQGTVTGALSRHFRRLFPFFLTSPDPVLFPIGGMNMNYMKARFALEDRDLVFFLAAFMTNFVDMLNYIKKNWEMICDDIENGTINEEVCEPESRPAMMKYVKKNPERAAELRKIFQEGFDTPIIPRLWPKFSWACGIGNATFSPYCEKFKKYAGEDALIDYCAYAASEGIFATATDSDDPRFTPLTDSCFFEFLPADAAEGDADTLTIDQLEEGKEYEIIITNQCGFYRYRIKDVIRVLGFHNKMPLITFAYRKGQLANIAAEKVTEEQLTEAVKRLSDSLHVDFNDYCLYVDTNSDVSRYVLLLEPDQPMEIDKDGTYGRMFGKILSEVNGEYHFIADLRKSIGTPLVLIQQQETHALWREFRLLKGSSSNQIKPVRLLDTPQKMKFFLGLIEDGQEVPDWNVYAKK